MPEKSSGAKGRAPSRRLHRAFHGLHRALHGLYHAFRRSPAGRGWQRGSDLELMHRSMGFAALGFLTLVPLLIVVAAADPENGQGFARWLADGLGVSSTARHEVERLFAQPRKALETTTAFGLAALAVFGLTFGTSVQTGYEKIWELPPARWHTMWRHLIWLTSLVAYIFLSADVARRPVYGYGVPGTFVRASIAALSAVLFFWWSQHVLLGGRVRWGPLLPGALATVIGLIGLRIFSRLVFSPLIASNTVAYGSIGTVLVVQSWLVGVGVVVFGGALVGRLLYEERSQLAHFLSGRRK
jgi:membrane protein